MRLVGGNRAFVGPHETDIEVLVADEPLPDAIAPCPVALAAVGDGIPDHHDADRIRVGVFGGNVIFGFFHVHFQPGGDAANVTVALLAEFAVPFVEEKKQLFGSAASAQVGRKVRVG